MMPKYMQTLDKTEKHQFTLYMEKEKSKSTQNLLKGNRQNSGIRKSAPLIKHGVDDMGHYLRLRSVKNSSRVLALDRMHPSMQLVVVVLLTFCTPRMTMQR
jgi:hypothetical protein